MKKPIMGERRRPRFSLCWDRRRVTLRTKLDRSAYVCGESLRVKADIDNQSDEEARLKLRLVQVCLFATSMYLVEFSRRWGIVFLFARLTFCLCEDVHTFFLCFSIRSGTFLFDVFRLCVDLTKNCKTIVICCLNPLEPFPPRPGMYVFKANRFYTWYLTCILEISREPMKIMLQQLCQ